jgi:hypothetical protein
MPAFKIVSVSFDLSGEDFSGNGITESEYQKSLQKSVIGNTFVVDDEDEVAAAITDYSGFFVNSSNIERVPSVEVTLYSLFCGETNDTLKHFTIPITGKMTNLAIIRKVKDELGWSGVRCHKFDGGHYLELEPVGILQKAYIEPDYAYE